MLQGILNFSSLAYTHSHPNNVAHTFEAACLTTFMNLLRTLFKSAKAWLTALFFDCRAILWTCKGVCVCWPAIFSEKCYVCYTGSCENKSFHFYKSMKIHLLLRNFCLRILHFRLDSAFVHIIVSLVIYIVSININRYIIYNNYACLFAYVVAKCLLNCFSKYTFLRHI